MLEVHKMFHGADGCLSPRALCTMQQQSERCLHGEGEVKGGSLVGRSLRGGRRVETARRLT